MNTFKNRENRQKWGNKGNKEYERICRNEMDKVAPPWSEERPMDLLEQEVMDNLDSDSKRENERAF